MNLSFKKLVLKLTRSVALNSSFCVRFIDANGEATTVEEESKSAKSTTRRLTDGIGDALTSAVRVKSGADSDGTGELGFGVGVRAGDDSEGEEFIAASIGITQGRAMMWSRLTAGA